MSSRIPLGTFPSWLRPRLAGCLACQTTAMLLATTAPARGLDDWRQAHVLQGGGRMVYDSARQRVVLFTGTETWEWHGSQWVHRLPATRPTTRWGYAMAYDEIRQRVLLFGGDDDQTWEWDGSSWNRRYPAASPSARSGHAMVYDSVRRRIVLFGGYANPYRELADTWEWDGSTWSQRTPSSSPGARGDHAMAYDSTRQRVVLFGGGPGDRERDDTWEWDGSTWASMAMVSRPLWRQAHAMAYDAARERVVLFGGRRSGLSDWEHYGDTWEWDGKSWQARTASATPGAGSAALAYDARRRRLVLLASGTETWEWAGDAWTLRAATPRGVGALAYDSGRRCVVQFGGLSDTRVDLADTWEWSGSGWVRRGGAGGPLGRHAHALAYDAKRGRVLLFGGRQWTYWPFDPRIFGDTWEWDGAAWLERSPRSTPGARYGHAMTADLARARVLLFGGETIDTLRRWIVLADTWEWDGSEWRQRSPAASPSARSGHAMAFDQARKRVVLFGGRSPQSTGLADTWEWDGSTWSERRPRTTPPPATWSLPAMVYDQARQRIVLLVDGMTWEWDGANWSRRPTLAVQPSGAAAYDAARQEVVLASTQGTWLHGSLAPAAAQPFGSPCGGRNGPPILAADPPHLGNHGYSLDVLAARPQSVVVVGLDPRAQSLPIGGGCTLYLRGAPILLAAPSNAFGFASVKLAIPFDRGLRGHALHAQGFVADPEGPVLGLSFTWGCTLMVGD